ncbi:DUF4240 domain-containing protein [Streptomyces zhihengii]|uniref:DUF4240 domain-containing protein n=1 Tax=Streptomyces zhihengii TaxID=1818004 RepID=UPI0034526104
MTWAEFWALIATLDGEATEENCHRLAAELSRRPVPDIIGFAERHTEGLHRLDQEQFGTLPVAGMTLPDGTPFPQSSDVFLYARCAVVAAGRPVWESVFSDADAFAPFTSTEYEGEHLLYVPDQAYQRATGRQWDHTTRYSYESCSNHDGWPHPRA